MGCLAINSFIDPILNYINTDKNIKKYFDFTYKSRKFQPRMLLEIIGRVLKEGISWRSIDTFYRHDITYPKWQTVYARSTKN